VTEFVLTSKVPDSQSCDESQRGRSYFSQSHSAKANHFLAVLHNPSAKIQELQELVATVDDGHSSIPFGIFSRGGTWAILKTGVTDGLYRCAEIDVLIGDVAACRWTSPGKQSTYPPSSVQNSSGSAKSWQVYE